MESKRILLVEGADDEHVLKHLCGNRGLGRLDVIPHEGITHLLRSFPERLKTNPEGFTGVVVDADEDIGHPWRSLRESLTRAGYQDVPDEPATNGTIIEPPTRRFPRVGIWIMPDNKSKGILEDFLRFLVPEGSKLFEHVVSSVKEIPEDERCFSSLAEPKAKIHTWLAWQEEPGKPLGQAVTARYLDPNVPQVDVLVFWLKRLFFSSDLPQS